MRTWKLSGLWLSIPVVILLFASGQTVRSVRAAGATTIYLPMVARNSGGTSAMVVDHRHTNVHQIPDYWIAEARKFVVHYAHTSHGSQVLTGLNWLAARDPKYRIDIHDSGDGTVEQPDDTTALRFYDGNNYQWNTYITPDLYWESADGLAHTQSVANTGWFNVSLWTWCGQMSYYDTDAVTQYLNNLAQLQAQYPAMRFIYYTGHTDGSRADEVPTPQLWVNNNLVRQYVQTNGKPLFDFADIESYDPAGTYYPEASDACDWCAGWCAAHPTAFECQDVPTDCAHTDGLQCTLKGQAFWWLMARLAGWNGQP